jgi:hypothetical protein
MTTYVKSQLDTGSDETPSFFDWLHVSCRISPVLPERPIEASLSTIPLRVQGALAKLG